MGRWVLPLLFAASCEARLVLVEPPPGACTPTQCTGCCDSRNTCVAGSEQSDAVCGQGGQVCSRCPSGQRCINGACVATGTCGTCAGCCSGPFCRGGNENISCGKGGEACRQCPGSQVCIDNACILCGPSNCSGCCDFFGQCVAGTGADDCGQGGSQCANCGLRACVGGVCR